MHDPEANFVLSSPAPSIETVPVTIALRDTFRPHTALASEIVDGELVVLHLDDGVYYGLDQIGTHIWRRLGAGDSIEAVLQHLVHHYPQEAVQKLTSDLLSLTHELLSANLLLPGKHGSP